MYQFWQRQQGLYPVPESAVHDAMDHALKAFPNESCGAVVGGEYFPMANVHPLPQESFEVNPVELVMLIEKHGSLQAVMHSHPRGQRCPSFHDMEKQITAKIPFGIIVMGHSNVIDVVFFGDDVPIAPEIGRPFIHGVYDCYALGRDHYRNKYNILLPNFPRQDQWWDQAHGATDSNMFLTHFQEAGFFEIGFLDMQPGDAMICKLTTAPTTNHCGVYLGNGLVRHHLHGSVTRPRLSTDESVYNWRKFSTHSFRHKSLQEPAT
jgi:proteasome lid subunit RPN8/RPN11